MSVFKQLSREEIVEQYNAKGLLMFCVPVYCKLNEREELLLRNDSFPQMREANGVPRFVFFLASILYGAWVYATMSSNANVRTPMLVYREIQ